MVQEQEIRVSKETKEQMERFRRWVISDESRSLSLADKGVLYTLIGMSGSNFTIGQVESFMPDSNRSVHRHIRGLEEKGLVTLIPICGRRQIAAMHYRVNL